MKRFVATTAMTIALAAPAVASPQLAESIGVEPGMYSLSELVQLRTAIEEGDWQRVEFIKSNVDMRNFDAEVTPAQAQLAAALNVDPAEYTLAELVQIREARLNGDATALEFELQEGDDIVSTQSMVTPGEAQLAASLGLDPADYTLGELARIAAEREDD